MNAMRTILFPTNLSRNTQEVFNLACSIARDRGARLVVLHVLPKAPLPSAPRDPVEREHARHAEEDWASYSAEMTSRLRGLCSSDDRVRVEHLVKEGDRAAVVPQTARQLNCDLIVLETPRKSDEERRVFGSVSAEILRQPPCPVMMLRFPEPA